MNSMIKELMNALGATAEVCWAFYTHLKKAGFSDAQAMELVKAVPEQVFKPSKREEAEPYD